jgi:hypothetical protein
MEFIVVALLGLTSFVALFAIGAAIGAAILHR